MRAVVIQEPGEPDVLQLSEVPDPVPAPGEVLVDITAAGVNRADLMQRRGLYPPPPGAPPYPGLECSGRIAGLGAGPAPEGFSVGTPVCALLAGGGYAEKVAVPAGQVLPVPGGVTITDAAALPEAACTVYSNVFQRAALAPGETLLVHGGASGIGTFAIQLGKAHGARVACTASSPAKLERCRQLGADLAINYADDDFVTAIRDFTGGRGADVILDIIGAAYLARNLAALATGGRLAVIGMQGGNRAELDLGLLAAKRASVQATTLRARPVAEKAAIVAAVREHVWPLIAGRRVVPVVDRVLALTEAPEAHRVMEAGTHIGKILLGSAPHGASTGLPQTD
jgi:putative PIG3 family NAD(P)H quinone oxidoreductase